MQYDLGRRTVSLAANVRFGSLADKVTSPRHVRFTPNNGRWTAHPSQHFGCAFMSTRPLIVRLPVPNVS
jgi:hypothetical protein